jgi:hypothetical protein
MESFAVTVTYQNGGICTGGQVHFIIHGAGFLALMFCGLFIYDLVAHIDPTHFPPNQVRLMRCDHVRSFYARKNSRS